MKGCSTINKKKKMRVTYKKKKTKKEALRVLPCWRVAIRNKTCLGSTYSQNTGLRGIDNRTTGSNSKHS